MSINQRILDILPANLLIRQLFLQVSDWVGEFSKSEVSIDVSSVPSLCFHLITRDVQESPDLEDAVDEAKWTDSQGSDEGTHWDAVDEDEDPQQDGRIEDVMEDFCANEEGARSKADAEANHLDEGQNDCEDVKLGHEYFDEGDEKKRNYDDPLAFHHECSSSVLLKELAWEESHDDLEKIEIDEDGENAFRIFVVSHWEEGNIGSEIAKSSSTWKLIEEDNSAGHYEPSVMGFRSRIEEGGLFSLDIHIRQSLDLLELFNSHLLVNQIQVMLQSLIVSNLDHALHGFISILLTTYG